MNIAAQDGNGILVSIVSVDDAWWSLNKVQAVFAMSRRGFDCYPLTSVEPDEVERKISSSAEWTEWLSTLSPA